MKAGINPLGHEPMSKVKLEGPKVRHDNHGADASKPMTGDGRAVPNGPWEMKYNPGPAGSATPAGAFLPKRAKDRPTPHSKINECDH
jgi:hypothetical protein